MGRRIRFARPRSANPPPLVGFTRPLFVRGCELLVGVWPPGCSTGGCGAGVGVGVAVCVTSIGAGWRFMVAKRAPTMTAAIPTAAALPYSRYFGRLDGGAVDTAVAGRGGGTRGDRRAAPPRPQAASASRRHAARWLPVPRGGARLRPLVAGPRLDVALRLAAVVPTAVAPRLALQFGLALRFGLLPLCLR